MTRHSTRCYLRTICLTGGPGLCPSWKAAAYLALSDSSSAFRDMLRSGYNTSGNNCGMSFAAVKGVFWLLTRD